MVADASAKSDAAIEMSSTHRTPLQPGLRTYQKILEACEGRGLDVVDCKLE